MLVCVVCVCVVCALCVRPHTKMAKLPNADERPVGNCSHSSQASGTPPVPLSLSLPLPLFPFFLSLSRSPFRACFILLAVLPLANGRFVRLCFVLVLWLPLLIVLAIIFVVVVLATVVVVVVAVEVVAVRSAPLLLCICIYMSERNLQAFNAERTKKAASNAVGKECEGKGRG